ncbi:5'-nucleotidase-like [Limulus polyphemus]|uniref:5'-nucleotidase n=1 Tax=Limulus polyphemus TaxID=6850 RepID=A0ABM1B4K0_LIMPO|nr:5'-nucleotidase-like [Limulus polyphemus]
MRLLKVSCFFQGLFLCGGWFLVCLPTVEAFFNLTILHTNDIHSRFEQFNKFGGRCPEDRARSGECFGGIARQITKVKEIRSKEKNVIFLNGGDYFQGTLWYTVHRWKVVTDFVQRIDHDAMTLGNHEFDDGIAGVVPLLESLASKVPVVSCNINASKEPSMEGKFDKSIVLQVGEKKIGVIGYTTPETELLSLTGKVFTSNHSLLIGRIFFTFTMIGPKISEVDRMKKEGIDIFIAVGHSGFVKDKEIAKKVKGIDIVVGGHTNTFLYTGEPPSVEEPAGKYPIVVDNEGGNKALVVQDFAFGKYLGYLRVSFDDNGKLASWGGNPILLDNNTKEDPDTLAALVSYKTEVEKISKQKVGRTNVLLRGDRTLCRMQECNLGNFLADAALNQYIREPTDTQWNKYAIAIWNSGGIRASIDEKINDGDIMLEDILTVAPFGNTFDIVELYGKDLIGVMEFSVQKYDVNAEDPPGSFLQISGMKVTYDITKPSGQRVVSLFVRCTKCRVPRFLPVNESDIYSVVTPSYLANGGDGYKIIKEKAIRHYNPEDLDTDIIQKYVLKMSPITTGLEDRIVFRQSSSECNAVSNNLPKELEQKSQNNTEIQSEELDNVDVDDFMLHEILLKKTRMKKIVKKNKM